MNANNSIPEKHESKNVEDQMISILNLMKQMKRSVHKNFEDYLLQFAIGSLHSNYSLSRKMFRTGLSRQLCLVFALSIFCANGFAQFTTGGVNANFSIDADTRAGYKKYGPAASGGNVDDWFASAGLGGTGVIDTSNAAYYRSQLQANKNISFFRNMSSAMFAQSNGKILLDAVYLRDYSAIGKDSTAFGTAAKNGDNPNTWDCRPSNVPSKDDIIDGYAHLRRDGSTVTDPLWLFAGVSTQGVNGDRYVDVELYKNDFSLNRTTGKFYSAGLSQGHTEWLFDAFGNVIQTGDVIISITYPAGDAPEVEVRIWVSKVTSLLGHPALFNFGTFDGSLYGYASITPKSAGANFTSALGNVSNIAANDTTLAAPWGTLSTGSAWSAKYSSLQFIEVGVNLSRIGLDPTLYASLSNPCSRMFASIFFKSRSSHSFTANQQDFAGPVTMTAPVMNFGSFTVKSDTLSCNKPIATLSITSNSGAGVYNWTTLNGNIVSTSADGSSVDVKKAGVYVASMSLANGCPIMKTETVIVLADSIAPVASTDLGLTPSGDLQLLGGDASASNFLTPFGASKGLKWDWKGPNNFASNEQNPLVFGDWIWGSYYLTVTEQRNGCKAMAMMDISFGTLRNRTGDLTVGTNNLSKVTAESPAANMISTPYLYRNPSNTMYLSINQNAAAQGTMTVLSINGALLAKTQVNLVKGANSVEVPATGVNEIRIVSFYVGKQLVFTRKVF